MGAVGSLVVPAVFKTVDPVLTGWWVRFPHVPALKKRRYARSITAFYILDLSCC